MMDETVKGNQSRLENLSGPNSLTKIPRNCERMIPQQHLLCHRLPSDHIDLFSWIPKLAATYLLVTIAAYVLFMALVTLDTPCLMPEILWTRDLVECHDSSSRI